MGQSYRRLRRSTRKVVAETVPTTFSDRLRRPSTFTKTETPWVGDLLHRVVISHQVRVSRESLVNKDRGSLIGPFLDRKRCTS